MNKSLDERAAEGISSLGPAVFWGAFISLCISFFIGFADFHSINLPVFGVLAASGAVAPTHTTWSTVFFSLFLLRLYMGVVFLSYDETLLTEISKASRHRKILYFLIQFALVLTVSLTSTIVAYNGYHGYLIACFITLGALGVFWLVFWREVLVNDRQRHANAYVLIGDLFFPIFLAFIQWGDISQASGWILLVFGVIFLLEIVFTYLQAISSFLRATFMWFDGSINRQ